MKVNGREYPLWGQFVEKKAAFIGGTLTDNEMGVGPHASTTITDVTLVPNGPESAFFSFHGEDFDCGFDVQYGGVTAPPRSGVLRFVSNFGGDFTVEPKAVIS